MPQACGCSASAPGNWRRRKPHPDTVMKQPDKTGAKKADSINRSWVLIGTGTLLASMTVSGFFLGYWVDVWLDTKPIFMLLFGILGLVGGMLKVYKLLA